MTRAEKEAAKKLDKRIEAIYCNSCFGIQIDIMDIPKVFAVGRKAALAGEDVKTAIVTFVESIRKN